MKVENILCFNIQKERTRIKDFLILQYTCGSIRSSGYA